MPSVVNHWSSNYIFYNGNHELEWAKFNTLTTVLFFESRIKKSKLLLHIFESQLSPFESATLLLESISPTYYVQLLRRYFCAKKVQTLYLSTKKLREKVSYEKASCIMSVKLTLGHQKNVFYVQTTKET